MKNKTTVLAQEEKVAIDCAVRHISELFHQCAEHREADFGEACSQCQYMPECNCDFLNTLEPLDDCQYPPGRSPEHLTERE